MIFTRLRLVCDGAFCGTRDAMDGINFTLTALSWGLNLSCAKNRFSKICLA